MSYNAVYQLHTLYQTSDLRTFTAYLREFLYLNNPYINETQSSSKSLINSIIGHLLKFRNTQTIYICLLIMQLYCLGLWDQGFLLIILNE